MARSEPKEPANETEPAEAKAKARAPRRLDALGMVTFGLYILVGGFLVFGFGTSLKSAVQTQNETSCRALRPMHARVTGRVLDPEGVPVPKAQVVPVMGGRTGPPVTVSAEDGSFTAFMPMGAQALRVSGPGRESLEAGFVLARSEVVDVTITLAEQGEPGGTFEIGSRGVYEAPNFVVQDLAGNEVQLSDFRGKLVVLNFWATFCEPCITEWPQLATLAERIAGEQEVVVLAVSIDAEPDPIAPFLEQMTLHDTPVQVLWDPTQELHKQLGSEKIPDTYFIDENGRITGVFVSTREWGSPGALHCVESSAGR